MKLDILAIGVHPDDVELSCSGTLISAVAQGKKVGIVDLTRGELGTRGTPELRLQEAQNAMKIIGASVRENLGMQDGFFANDNAHKLKLISAIRKYKPDFLLANAISDRHPDHGRAGQLIYDCSFYCGLRKIETFDNETGEPQAAWRPKHLLHYIQDRFYQPTLVIDTTPYFETKMKSILAYQSQFYDANSTEPKTYISSDSFLDGVKSRDMNTGKIIGVKYAEGFFTHNPPGITDLNALAGGVW
jgi:bacillithiol biosynthesis deacetylase BshB1